MGKLIGGLIGFFLFNIFGALIGVWIGHAYDSSKSSGGFGFSGGFGNQAHPDTQKLFFETLFQLLGHLAKADGRVSEAEIKQAEELMRQSGLTEEHRQQAIHLFKKGTAPDFNLDQQLDAFISVCGRNARLKQTLLIYLITMAHADGTLDQIERGILERVAARLSIPGMVLNQLINMVGAQAHFRSGAHGYGGYQQSGTQRAPSPNELELAYKALGVGPDASDRDLKKAYRKLMSENHPDKLMGQGVPEDMIAMATERSKEISKAYDLIKESRK